MTIQDAIYKRVKELKCNESSYKIAINSELPSCTLNDFLRHKTSLPTILTLARFCQGIGISLEEFFKSPLFDNLDLETK